MAAQNQQGLSLSISNFSPSAALAAATVTINGIGLTGASAVLIAGTAATSFVVVSDTVITAVVPAGIVKGNITVTVPSGSATSAFNFTLLH